MVTAATRVCKLRHTLRASKRARVASPWRKGEACRTRASSVASEQPAAAAELRRRCVLASLFALWYGFNVVFNVYNKKALLAYPSPMWMTTSQFAIGSSLALCMWAVGAHPRPTVTLESIRAVLPLAVVHTLGNLLTNVSLGKVAVSFTHTIKALEPLFSIALSAIFLGDTPSRTVLATLMPIVGGVAIASASEATFNWPGFLSAMGSNLTFQSRNVLSKLLMGGRKPMDNINLFSLITLLSVPLTLPVALIAEGISSPIPAALSQPATHPQLVSHVLIAGATFHLYQQVSYMILQRVVPVTHSIGNCIKRVVIIASSIVVFRNPVSIENAVGTSVALGGVFLYNYVRLHHVFHADPLHV